MELTKRQQAVFDEMSFLGDLAAVEAGQFLHASRKKHDENAICSTCFRDGRSVLEELEKKGLIERCSKYRIYRVSGGNQREGDDPLSAASSSQPPSRPEGLAA